MERTLKKDKTLNKRDISKFQDMTTKEKIREFASMLPNIDPEVAKKALEQFPEFSQTASMTIKELRSMVDQALMENSKSVEEVYKSCHLVLESLQGMLDRDNLSENEKQYIIEKMLEVAEKISRKDTENKQFVLKVVGILAAASLCLLGTTATVLGNKINIRDKNVL